MFRGQSSSTVYDWRVGRQARASAIAESGPATRPTFVDSVERSICSNNTMPRNGNSQAYSCSLYLYSHTYDSDNFLYKVHRTNASGSVSTITLGDLGTGGEQSLTKIASLANGTYAVAHRSGSNLKFELYDSEGSQLTGKINVDNNIDTSNAAGLSIESEGSSGFIIATTNGSQGSDTNQSYYRYTNAGVLVGSGNIQSTGSGNYRNLFLMFYI